MITLYNPTGEGGHQGGGVAAPIASQVLGEVLPYLEITKDNELETDQINKVKVPNIVGLSVDDANKILKEQNLCIELTDGLENVENAIIKEQIPVNDIEVFEGSKVIVK